MKYLGKLNEIPTSISKQNKWKSIGNLVKISMKNPFEISIIYQLKSLGYSVESSMKFKWKSIGNPVGIQ